MSSVRWWGERGRQSNCAVRLVCAFDIVVVSIAWRLCERSCKTFSLLLLFLCLLHLLYVMRCHFAIYFILIFFFVWNSTWNARLLACMGLAAVATPTQCIRWVFSLRNAKANYASFLRAKVRQPDGRTNAPAGSKARAHIRAKRWCAPRGGCGRYTFACF